jgi:hypothetical protein
MNEGWAMDMLRKGSEWMQKTRTRIAAQTVAYVRGALSVDVSATVGTTIFRIEKSYGIREHFESRDYLILAADLILGGNLASPQPGDHIKENMLGKIFTYEVMAPGGEPCWRYSDPYRQTFRIHTKLIAVEVAP